MVFVATWLGVAVGVADFVRPAFVAAVAVAAFVAAAVGPAAASFAAAGVVVGRMDGVQVACFREGREDELGSTAVILLELSFCWSLGSWDHTEGRA